LFTVLNEHGQVLSSAIVPSDERVHVSKTLDKIWRTTDRSIVTTHVFTDNSVKGNSVWYLSMEAN